MENVLYILGAGFSAPLSIPTMGDFISKSKGMYALSPEKYSYFHDVFVGMDQIGGVQRYLSCNTFNLEEVLSVLEMRAFIEGTEFADMFKQYIAEVISYHTPKIPDEPLNMSQWGRRLWGAGILAGYGAFIASLLRLTFTGRPDLDDIGVETHGVDYRYAIISLNYDMVIENFVEHIKGLHLGDVKIRLKLNSDDVTDEADCFGEQGTLSLAKIHGTLEPLNIIPPTWNKTTGEGIHKVWQLAKQLIQQANYIRFMGYSFPQSDNHLKYLLTTGMTEKPTYNLNGVDVLCLDPTREVKQRFDRLITYPNYRFTDKKVESYFVNNLELAGLSSGSQNSTVRFDQLEDAHDRFFEIIENGTSPT